MSLSSSSELPGKYTPTQDDCRSVGEVEVLSTSISSSVPACAAPYPSSDSSREERSDSTDDWSEQRHVPVQEKWSVRHVHVHIIVAY